MLIQRPTTTKTETNQYAVASQIESGVSLPRAHIAQPVHVHQPSSLPLRVSHRVIEKESLKAVERVRVRTIEESEARKPSEYAVINKVTPIVDAEMITIQQQQQQNDSSSEDRSSTSASITDDTFNNINYESFEPVVASSTASSLHHHHRVRVAHAREEKAVVAETTFVKTIEHPPVIKDETVHTVVRIPVKVSIFFSSTLVENLSPR